MKSNCIIKVVYTVKRRFDWPVLALFKRYTMQVLPKKKKKIECTDSYKNHLNHHLRPTRSVWRCLYPFACIFLLSYQDAALGTFLGVYDSGDSCLFGLISTCQIHLVIFGISLTAPNKSCILCLYVL